MDITVYPRKLSGTVKAIPSKSQAHRMLICASFSDKNTMIICPETNQDIEATAGCLRALGAVITRTDNGYYVCPIQSPPTQATLNCYESGSTLRFMLPVAGALGITATFLLSGRLPNRPLSPLWEEMERHGCRLSRPSTNTILCSGRLHPGDYRIDGGVSSQFITGLLFALSLVPLRSTLQITGKLESKPYVDMTLQTLAQFGVTTDGACIHGSFPFHSPNTVTVEGDWSNAAFFLTARFLGSNLEVTNLSPNSAQGDREIVNALSALKQHAVIDARDIPDLVPVLAVAAGASKGAVFAGVSRLRLKESDRVESVATMLRKLGAAVHTDENSLTVSPAPYRSCTIDSVGDHRIAMAAAVAATVASGPVTILGAQCVEKSYPSFWETYRKLGGHYEQHIR